MADTGFIAGVRGQLGDYQGPFALVTVANVTDKRAGDEMEEILRVLVPRSRTEAGNLAYDANRDLVDRTRFVFYDRWESLAAIAAHEQSGHARTSLTRMGELFAAPPTVMLVQFLG